MNIIGDIVQGINSAFSVINQENEEDLQTNALLAESLGMPDLKGIPLQQWFAPMPQMTDSVRDNSYNTLSYLNKLGYTHAVWEVCESHSEWDICDTLHGRQFTIHELLLNSQHTPPSPIFTLSHPGCFCFLKVFPPTGPEGIPDEAPGLPYSYLQVTPITKKKTLKYKKELYRKMFEVFIDAFTLLPPQDDILKYSAENLLILNKYAKSKDSVFTYVNPIIINKDITAYMPFFLRRHIPKNTIGLQIKISNNFSIVYITTLNRLVVLPNAAISTFTFSKGIEAEYAELERGDFIVLEQDILAIVQRKTKKGFSCYVPEWNSASIIEEASSIIKLIK